MHVITRAALQPDVLCLWFKVQVGTSLGSSKHPFWRSWRDAVSAAVGVQGRFCGARRGEGMWGHDWGGFPGRRPCRTSGRGGGRCGWAVCEAVT
jgi:hypothetical protein